jgi:hypothetical protein
MLDHPRALFGLSDAGAHVGTVCDASATTFMLTHWVRDRPDRAGGRCRWSAPCTCSAAATPPTWAWPTAGASRRAARRPQPHRPLPPGRGHAAPGARHAGRRQALPAEGAGLRRDLGGGALRAARRRYHRRTAGPAGAPGPLSRAGPGPAPAVARGAPGQATATSMRRGCACSALGMRTRSTPWLSSAPILPASSSLLSVKLRR